MQAIWTVSQLNEQIKNLLETRFEMLWIEGEISNLRRPASGHSYFTLKDERSQIRAVIFRTAHKPPFELEDGQQIACRARLTAYTPRGEYQLIIDRVEPRGLGALQKAFEQLKIKLQQEGLFDDRHKKPLPFLPKRIGVITSATGAVIRDILQVTGRHFPSVNIIIAPVRVQGQEAALEIVAAIGMLNGDNGAIRAEIHPLISEVDVIILARGGGSLEDLYPFNTEAVARAVYSSRIPIISAVGHETDYTIADFVADLRAPTPSAAAEIVVPSREYLYRQIEGAYRRMVNFRRHWAYRRRERLDDLSRRLKTPERILDEFRLLLDDRLGKLAAFLDRLILSRRHELQYLEVFLDRVNPRGRIDKARMVLAHRQEQYIAAMKNCLGGRNNVMEQQRIALQSLSPLSVLKRGYSIVRRLPTGIIVKNVAELALGDRIDIQAASGNIRARVEEVC